MTNNRAWIGIGMGILLLGLMGFDGFHLHNGWALFLLLPGTLMALKAHRIYHRVGHISPEVAEQLMGATPLLTVALIFLLGLDFGRVWPIFIVMAGLMTLLRNQVTPKTYQPEDD